MENMDHGKFFELLYEGEDDILKLDVLEMVASVRQTYLFNAYRVSFFSSTINTVSRILLVSK